MNYFRRHAPSQPHAWYHGTSWYSGTEHTLDALVVKLGRGIVRQHRSRRQHFSPCFFRGQGVVEVAELPARTRALWPRLSEVHGLDTSAASPAGTCLPSASPPLAPPSAKRRKAKG